jgi:hypothetical protein
MAFGCFMAFFAAAALLGAWKLFAIALHLRAFRRAAPRLLSITGSVVAVHRLRGFGHGGTGPGRSQGREAQDSYTIDVLFETPAGEKVTFGGGTGTTYRPHLGNPVDVLFDPLGEFPPVLKRDAGLGPGLAAGLGAFCLVLAFVLAWIAFGSITGRLQTGV